MSPEEAHGVLDEAIRQLVVLQKAVLDARLHARLGHPHEVEQRAFDALVTIRGLEREIRMNVLPRLGHIRSVSRQAKADARGDRMDEAFLLLDSIHNVVALISSRS